MDNITEDYTIGSCTKVRGLYHIELDGTANGCCFKDAVAYNHHRQMPCYMAENAQEGAFMNPDGTILIYPNSPTDRERYYTHDDFIRIAKEYFSEYQDEYREQGIDSVEDLADVTFEQIDWQYPETYMQELTLFP